MGLVVAGDGGLAAFGGWFWVWVWWRFSSRVELGVQGVELGWVGERVDWIWRSDCWGWRFLSGMSNFSKVHVFVFVCSWDFDIVLLITCNFVLTFFLGVTDRVLI